MQEDGTGHRRMCSMKHLSKRYGTTVAVSDVSLDLHRNEMVSIIGPSGAGKTTLLRLLAGLERPDEGSIDFADGSQQRDPAVLVFQDFLLFPTMTVARNIGFGLRARGWKRRDIRERVDGLMARFGLTDKADSYPALLSAGQQQRVAIARALAVRPTLLLLDEPFGHLDKNLKMETARYLRHVQQEFGITAVAVTHDLEEAFAMSDRVGIMMDGRLTQAGAVSEVYSRPATFEIARFLGPVNRFPAALLECVQWTADAPAGNDLHREALQRPDGRLFCRAESVAITPNHSGPATVREVIFAGTMVMYRVTVPHNGVDHELTALSLQDGIKPGTRVSLTISQLFTEETGKW